MSMSMNLKHAKEAELFQLAENADALMDDGFDGALDLHKSWHVLHYLFTGQAWDGPMPAGALLAGGREVGEDLGYGPARVLSAKDTKDFADFLARQSAAALAGHINPATMERLGVYSVDDDSADDVDHYLPQLQAYVRDAASQGHGLLIWMC